MLGWFDNVDHYWLMVLIALFVTTALAVVPAFMESRTWKSVVPFVLLVGLTLIAGRWPVFFTGQTLEYDESFNVANAMTAAVHPVPWRSYDPATVGPLEIDYLALPKLLGITPGYDSTHVMTAVLLWIMLVCLYLFMRRFTAEAIARVAVLPALIFLTLTFNNEFQQYASELCAMMIASIALVTASVPWTTRRAALWSALGTGVLVGALPMAKAQSIPIGVFIGLLYLAVMPWRNRSYMVDAARVFVAGAIGFPALILVIVAVSGAWHDFVMSYIVMQTNYVAGGNTAFGFIFADATFSEFVLVSLAVALLGFACVPIVRGDVRLPAPLRFGALAAIGFLAVSLEVIFVPHKPWMHYVLFLLPPLTLLAGASLAVLYAQVKDGWPARAVVVVAAVAIFVPMVRQALTTAPAYVGHLAELRSAPPDPIAVTIRGILEPGSGPENEMALWGAAQDLYPKTGALMGTRDNNTYFQMTPTPEYAYFRDRYVADVMANQPRLFVDAVAPGQMIFVDRKVYGYETLPGLKAVVHARYALVCEVLGVRIFERRQDVAASEARGPLCLDANGRPVFSAREIAQLSQLPTNAVGTIDSVTSSSAADNATGTFPRNMPLGVNGWAADPVTQKPGAGLILILDGKQRIDASLLYGSTRRDVATALKNDALAHTGFLGVPLPRGALRRGPHTLRFGLIAADYRHFYPSEHAAHFTIR